MEKSMKLKDIKPGMQVAINDLPDTQVYTVNRIDGNLVTLEYPTREHGISSGGGCDYRLLSLPSHEQYRNHIQELQQWHAEDSQYPA